MKIKSSLAAAVVAAALVFQSVAASACCGAVGADGNTPILARDGWESQLVEARLKLQ